MKKIVAILLLLLLAGGCKKNPQRVEIAKWKKGNHLDTPLGFAMFMSQNHGGGALSDWTSGITNIVRLSVETGNIEEPLAVIPILKRGNDRIACLQQIVMALAKSGNIEKLREVVNLAQSFKNDGTRAGALRAIAATIAVEGQFAYALEIAEAMKGSEHRPKTLNKVDTLTTISEALIAAGKRELALKSLENARELLKEMPDDLAKTQTRFEISFALIRAGGTKQALILAEQMRDPSDKARVLTGIARSLFESGDRQQALALLQRSLDHAKQENWDLMKSMIAPDIASLFADLGDFGQALATAAKLDDSETRFDILARKAAALTEMGELEEALKAARAIPEPGYALGQVAVALARKEEVAKALEVVSTIQNEYSRASAMVDISEALIEAEHIEQGLEVLERLATSDLPTLGETGYLVSSLVRSGKLPLAHEVATRLKDSYQKVLALVEIAVAQVQAADNQQALQILQQALDTADKLDASHQTPVARLKIGTAQLQVGQRQEALASASQAVEASGTHSNKHNKESILLEATFLRSLAEGRPGSLEVLKQALVKAHSNPDAKKRRATVAFLGIALAVEFDPDRSHSAGDQALAERILRNVAIPLRIKKTFNSAEQEFARELLEAFQAD